MIRFAAVCALLLSLTGCGDGNLANDELLDLGDFVLGHNIVVSSDLTKGPLSREASKEDWIASVKEQVGKRMGRYDGERLVHLGINVGGYVLAQPGLPLVLSPKSVLVLDVTAWDDAANRKFHEKPHQIVVSESVSGKTLLGSGLTSTPEEQMQNLSFNAAASIERWLALNKDCMTGAADAEIAADCWRNKPLEDDF